MLTFLSSPKPFVGLDAHNQKNAIMSWLKIDPNVDVIIYGREKNAAEACHTLGVRYVPEIECSVAGLPFYNAITDHAEKHGKYDIQIYLNCDIILSKKVLKALKTIIFEKYLIIGQRIDLSPGVSIQLDQSQWIEEIVALADRGKAILHSPAGKDYFIFPRGLWKGLPPLTIGRAGYDSALLAFCLRQNIPVIDASFSIPALHQAHEYKMIKGTKRRITLDKEAESNLRLHDIVHSAPSISDTNWRIVGLRLERNRARGDWLRYSEIWLRYHCRMKVTSYFVRVIWRLLTRLMIYKEKKISIYDVIAQYTELIK